jgi:TolB protein
MAARLTPAAIAAALALILICAASSATAGLSATIYSIRPDGTERTPVLHLDPPVYLLIRSQDGEKIAYSRDLRVQDLYVSDISGNDPVQIHPPGYPSFSPDGTRLAVTSRAGAPGLYVVNTDDTGQSRVADYGGQVSWSPDGRRIAYVVGTSRNVWDSAVHVVSAEGAHDDLPIARGQSAQWAPRGNRIAYLALRGGYAVPCFVNPDGSRRACYHGFSVNGQFVWSPDGTRIAFMQASPYRLAVVTADGRHIRRFPVLRQRTRPVAWSPDGRWLAYSKQTGSGYQIFVRPAGRRAGERQVTNEVRGGYFMSTDVRWRSGRISYLVYEPSP